MLFAAVWQLFILTRIRSRWKRYLLFILPIKILADSAHDVLAVMRFIDNDTYDGAEVLLMQCDVQQPCRGTWMQRRCLQGGGTFANRMLLVLARPRLNW